MVCMLGMNVIYVYKPLYFNIDWHLFAMKFPITTSWVNPNFNTNKCNPVGFQRIHVTMTVNVSAHSRCSLKSSSEALSEVATLLRCQSGAVRSYQSGAIRSCQLGTLGSHQLWALFIGLVLLLDLTWSKITPGVDAYQAGKHHILFLSGCLLWVSQHQPYPFFLLTHSILCYPSPPCCLVLSDHTVAFHICC